MNDNAILQSRSRWRALVLSISLLAGLPALASIGLSGQPAPDFALTNSSGERVRLADLKGDVVMINFWATWCGPCREEMPLLDELYTRYSRVGFNLVGVNIDDDPARARDMLESLGVDFPVVFDSDKRVSQLYEVEAMPVTILLDRDTCITATSQATKTRISSRSAN